MKTLLLPVLLLCPVLVQASFVKIISPSTAQTYSFSDIKWNSLRWDETVGSSAQTSRLAITTT